MTRKSRDRVRNPTPPLRRSHRRSQESIDALSGRASLQISTTSGKESSSQQSTGHLTPPIKHDTVNLQESPQRQAGDDSGPSVQQGLTLIPRHGDRERHVTLTGQLTSQAALNTPPPSADESFRRSSQSRERDNRSVPVNTQTKQIGNNLRSSVSQEQTLMSRHGDRERHLTLNSQPTSQGYLNTPPSLADGSARRQEDTEGHVTLAAQFTSQVLPHNIVRSSSAHSSARGGSRSQLEDNSQSVPVNPQMQSSSQQESQNKRLSQAHSQVFNPQPSTSQQIVGTHVAIEHLQAGQTKQIGNNFRSSVSQEQTLMSRHRDRERHLTLNSQPTSQGYLNTPPPLANGSDRRQEDTEGHVTLAAQFTSQVPPHNIVRSSSAHSSARGGSRSQLEDNSQSVPVNPQLHNTRAPEVQYQRLSQAYSQDFNPQLLMRREVVETVRENIESTNTDSYQQNKKSYHQYRQPNQRNKKFRANSYNQRIKGVEKATKSLAETEERLRELEKIVKNNELKESVPVEEVKSNQALMSAVTHMAYPTPPQSPQIPVSFMTPSPMVSSPIMQNSLNPMHSFMNATSMAGISPLIHLGAMPPMVSTMPSQLNPMASMHPLNSGLSAGMPTVAPIIQLNPNLRRNVMSNIHPYVFDPYTSHFM